VVVDEHDIAFDQMAYLKNTENVCAVGSTTGWMWLRYHSGDWQAIRFATEDIHTSEYVHGKTLDREAVVNWLVDNPVTMEPQSKTHRWSPDDKTVWEYAEQQDVFDGKTRCVWCGYSTRTRELDSYATVEDGDANLCDDCHSDWDRAGEIE
jgi:hypothetical protein